MYRLLSVASNAVALRAHWHCLDGPLLDFLGLNVEDLEGPVFTTAKSVTALEVLIFGPDNRGRTCTYVHEAAGS